MNVLVEAATAVETALNAGTFSLAFTAVRKYRPVYQLEDMGTLHVTVAGSEIEITTPARGVRRYELRVDVGVQLKPEADTNELLDPLSDLLEEIVNHFAGLEVLPDTDICWVGAVNSPAYSYEHLDRWGQFTGVAGLLFKAQRRVTA